MPIQKIHIRTRATQHPKEICVLLDTAFSRNFYSRQSITVCIEKLTILTSNTGIQISVSITNFITIESIQFYLSFAKKICKMEFNANIPDVTANIP